MAFKFKRTYGYAGSRYSKFKSEIANKSRVTWHGELIHSPLTETELSYRSGYLHAFCDSLVDSKDKAVKR